MVHIRSPRSSLVPLVALAVLPLLGCGDDNAGSDGATAADMTSAVADMTMAPPDQAKSADLVAPLDLTPLPDLAMLPATVLVAQLSGSQEVPPVSTMASGTATVSVAGDRASIDVTLDSALLGASTASHIHFGRPGDNGPVMFPLSSGATMTPVKKTLKAADFAPVMGGPQTFADAVTALLGGQCYVNVHTMGSPGGEIRGHVGGITFTAGLSGLQEIPSPGSASGSVKITIDNAHEQIDVTVDAGQLANITASHIHAGVPGRNGPVIFTLAGAFQGMAQKTLKAADLAPAGTYGINTFADAVVALLSGGTYANVHTMANPGGELRGALGAVTLVSTVSALQEVPPLASTGSGVALTTIDADQRQINLRLTHTGLMNTTNAHYHAGAPGAAGGVLFGLAAGGVASPLTKSLTSVDLTPAGNVATFGDAIHNMLAGRVYVNVHTMANPGGEIRGQVGPIQLKSTLSGGSEVPPNNAMGTGTGSVVVLGDQSAVDVTLAYTNVANITASHIHFGAAGANGPVILGLAAASFNSPLKKTLLPADLAPSMANNVNTFADAINAMVAQKTYINIHTMATPGGEIRGQVVP